MNSNPSPREDRATTRVVRMLAMVLGLLMVSAIVVAVAFKWTYHNAEPAPIATDKPLPGEPPATATK